MKYCSALAADPPLLAQFRVNFPGETDWRRFRQEFASAYNELAEALEVRQRGLCAYCEARLVTDIPTPARQVEHWRPKANGGVPEPDISFGSNNLHASCLGGAKPHLLPPFGSLGLTGGDNLSCGQKKGELDPEAPPLATRPYRPSDLPLSPPAFAVDIDGSLRPAPDAVVAGLDENRLHATIAFLGLNCDRLRIVRREVRDYLDKRAAAFDAASPIDDATERMRHALDSLARELQSVAGEPLPPFISLMRDYVGPAHDGALLPYPEWAVG